MFIFDINHFEILLTDYIITSLYYSILHFVLLSKICERYFTIKKLLSSFIIFLDFRSRDKLLKFLHLENLARIEQNKESLHESYI